MDGEASRRVVFRLPLRGDSDVAQARLRVRELCARYGFAVSVSEALATATSEITRNVIVHAREGEVLLGTMTDGQRTGVFVTARDEGPGLPDVELAMRDGYSTGAGLGLGLPSARRLVDEFTIQSVPNEGTTVTLIKWSSPEAANR
jgi:serine/threonine-protein kinase RsbT